MTDNITKEYFDKKFNKIDEKFNDVDKKFNKIDEKFNDVDKKFNKIDEKFDKVDEKFEEQGQIIIAAVDNILDKRLEKVEKNLKKEINNVQTLIDAYVKSQEDFKQEFLIIKQEMSRVKEILREKLGVEVRAMN